MPSAVAAGRRKPEKTNKQKILDTAMKLFGSQGFKATTIRQIGNKAGVAPSLLYRHFRDKDELRDALDDQVLAELSEISESLKADQDMKTVVAHYFQDTRHLFRYVAHSLIEPNSRSVEFQRQYFDIVKMMYGDDQARGNIRADLDIDQLSLLGVVNTFGIILFEPLVKEVFGHSPGDLKLEYNRRFLFDQIWEGGVINQPETGND